MEGRQFYFVGGGYAALTGAALLLREYGAAGGRIHVLPHRGAPCAPALLPLHEALEAAGVRFHPGAAAGLSLEEGEGLTVTAVHYSAPREEGYLQLHEGDFCFWTCGSPADCAASGSLRAPAPLRADDPPSFSLWSRIAAARPGLGSPAPFLADPERSARIRFTAAFRGAPPVLGPLPRPLPGSPWALALRPPRPAPAGEGEEFTLEGWVGRVDRPGALVAKPALACTGAELLRETLFCLGAEALHPALLDAAFSLLPYAGARALPHAPGDLPAPVPPGSENLAMIGLFAGLGRPALHPAQYAAASARTAVRLLMEK